MATFYIAPTGNDTTGNGTSALPWATISKAHTEASTGDTIICKAGTYTWVSQTFTKSLTVEGETGDAADVIFDGVNSDTPWSSTNRTVNISYITFYRSLQTTTACIYSATTAVFNVNNCIYLDNVLGSSTCIFRTDAGGRINATSVLVDNPTKNTAATNTAVTLFVGASPVINLQGITIAILSNSATLAGVVYAISLSGAPVYTIKNCIIYNSSGNTVNMTIGTATYTATYSDFYLITSPPAGTGNITSDPLFVDAANGDFRLRPASPARGTGTLI